MFGGAIEYCGHGETRSLARADRRGGRAACEEYGDGGEDTDAEVGLCGEREGSGPTAGASAGNRSNLLWIRTQAMCQLVIIPEQRRVVHIYGCSDYYRKVDQRLTWLILEQLFRFISFSSCLAVTGTGRECRIGCRRQ